MFPLTKLKLFDIFHPKHIPHPPQNNPLYGFNEIQEIHKYFKWKTNLNTLQNNWKNLLSNMYKETTTWCNYNNKETHVFWSNFLKISNIWTDDVKLLINTVLAIPFSSSDAERSFSFMNLFEKTRHNLQIESLDSLIRISMNGPIEISRFAAYDYAYNWIYIEKQIPVDAKSTLIEPVDNVDGFDPNNIYYDHSALF